MTIEEAIKFAEYAQIMSDGKPDVQEFYRLSEIALRGAQKYDASLEVLRAERDELHKNNVKLRRELSALRAKQETLTNRNGLNEPLTLDELRQMDGEPVFIKLFDRDEEFWVLRNEWVDTRNPEPMILFHMRWYSHDDYGKTWLAYRHKPEEGTK